MGSSLALTYLAGRNVTSKGWPGLGEQAPRPTPGPIVRASAAAACALLASCASSAMEASTHELIVALNGKTCQGTLNTPVTGAVPVVTVWSLAPGDIARVHYVIGTRAPMDLAVRITSAGLAFTSLLNTDYLISGSPAELSGYTQKPTGNIRMTCT